MKRIFAVLAVAAAAAGGFATYQFAGATPASAKTAEVWKAESCGCCGSWVTYMEEHGYKVTVHVVDDVDPLKDKLGIPEQARSCHTSKIGGLVVEGHVPVEAIDKVLAEHPKRVAGIAAPGMPSGSPGMDVDTKPFPVVTFGDGKVQMLGMYN